MSVTRRKNPSVFTYKITDTPLDKVSQHKYLGITITSELRWDTHISNVAASALRKLFFLKRSLRLSPPSTKLLAYTTFIRPILEYANTVWFPHTTTHIMTLENVQRKAIRFIHNKYRRTDSPTNLLSASGLHTLAIRARQARLKFLYQLLHNCYKIDVTKYISLSQSRRTRHQHDYTLTEYFCHNDTFKYSFFPRAIHEWNQLDPDITRITSSAEFAKIIDELSESQH